MSKAKIATSLNDGKRLSKPMGVAYGDPKDERTYVNKLTHLVNRCRRRGEVRSVLGSILVEFGLFVVGFSMVS